MTRFGDFDTLCRDTPSYTWCNLFYRQVHRLSFSSHKSLLLISYHITQILNKAHDVFTNASLPTSSAGLGVNPECTIPRMGHENSLGNIANIVVCALSMVFTAVLIWVTNKRKAAVGECPTRSGVQGGYFAGATRMGVRGSDRWVFSASEWSMKILLGHEDIGGQSRD